METGSQSLGSGQIRIKPDPDPNLDYCRQQEKNDCFCTTSGRNWNDCLPGFVTELVLE